MSANIDLSACKGKIFLINTGCLRNTDDALTSQSPAAGFQPHALSRAAEKLRVEGQERDQRQRQELQRGKPCKIKMERDLDEVKYKNAVHLTKA